MRGALRADGLLDMTRHLTSLQADLTAAVAPSADLVAWSRLGSSYHIRDQRRLQSLGIARPRGPGYPVEPLEAGEAGEPAAVYREISHLASWLGLDLLLPA